ncbi:hypothetical protein K435DRAFT_666976, partial [Dendrothele bispora CBS 962.96]
MPPLPGTKTVEFPPLPPHDNLIGRIITDWKNDFVNINETGYAVCGQIKPQTDMTALKNMKNYLHILNQSGVTRKERKCLSEPITEISGPTLLESSAWTDVHVITSLREGKTPRISLANGFWLGTVPDELKDLNFMEKLLIQKVRTNCCFVKVSTRMRKMVSHVIAFETPVAKVYD